MSMGPDGLPIITRGMQEAAMVSRSDAIARESAEASKDTAQLLNDLLSLQKDNETREAKMLFWARVAGWAALVAVVLAIVTIVVTVLVA